MDTALDTVLVDITEILTGRTLLTVLSDVGGFFGCLADTLAADALAVTATYFAVLWIDTGGIVHLTRTVRSAPARQTLALATVADAVVGTATDLAVVTLAGEVVTLAVVAGNLLGGVSVVAFANATSKQTKSISLQVNYRLRTGE